MTQRLLPLTLIAAALSACQAPVVNPNSSPGKVAVPQIYPKPTSPKTPTTDSTKQQPSAIEVPSRRTPIVKPPRRVTSQDILNQQRQQSAQANTQASRTKDGSNIPAFNKLMKIGVNQLRAGQLDSAQQTFTKAQRLGPHSPAVYMYLSEIAIKKRQGTQAENLARRGLLVSRSTRYDRALWKMILISGKMRNRSSVIQEAQKNLQRLQ